MNLTRSPLPHDILVYLDLTLYSCMLLVAGVGNVTMFCVLLRNVRKSKQNRVYLLLLHLNIADLLVTFVAMPNKIVTAATWHNFLLAGWLCPMLKFMDVFGLYASSGVLVSMSIDRLCAVIRPLYSLAARRAVKMMIAASWVCAAVLSVPQVSLTCFVELNGRFDC